jgi:sugar/nucleoside kinase (ribokinase family)
MADFDLVVLGDVNPDVVVQGDDLAPAFGQAEHIVDRINLTIGGSGAILACGAARLGLRVALVGVVGDDMFGRFMREQLVAKGVDVSGLRIDPERPTGATVVLSQPGDRAMLTATGTISALGSEALALPAVLGARHIHVSSYFLQLGLAPHLPDLFAQARDRGVSTSIDPNWDPSGDWDADLRPLLGLVDVFLPNAMEATRLTGTSDLDRALEILGGLASTVVIKIGADGAIATAAGTTVRVGAVAETVVDTTGAGDSFDAGFLAGFLGGESLETSLALGNACGALSTRVAGGTDAQPTMDEALAAVERGTAA